MSSGSLDSRGKKDAFLARARKRRMQPNQQNGLNEKCDGMKSFQHLNIESSQSTSKCFSGQTMNKNEAGDDEITIIGLKNCKILKKTEEAEIQFIGQKMGSANKIGNKKKNKEDEAEKMRNELLRGMATQALLRDAKRSSQRAQMFGPQGWLKPRSLATNKTFLARTLQSVELDRREWEERKAAAIKRAKKNDNNSSRMKDDRNGERKEQREHLGKKHRL